MTTTQLSPPLLPGVLSCRLYDIVRPTLLRHTCVDTRRDNVMGLSNPGSHNKDKIILPGVLD